MAETDITWRNILLLCGSTVAVTLSTSVFITLNMQDSQQETMMRQLEAMQAQIDQINARLNASHRDLPGD